ncbi:hypothetical protein J3R30DRAFT_824746 [Lentinula aciculospora]|uniref:Uncharacterized protein n=1 Tax=Lentinula aciculospora TaxID=153920 RepID=A0A9W9ABP9_9AGAR|nr:hypothetical protein J3R30DRAFT_2909911 [Lentinula aciculospora]KAJ4487634.1 hypothetical protein J3R30DRAFT_824746 [Lentinula aciculospora]
MEHHNVNQTNRDHDNFIPNTDTRVDDRFFPKHQVIQVPGIISPSVHQPPNGTCDSRLPLLPAAATQGERFSGMINIHAPVNPWVGTNTYGNYSGCTPDNLARVEHVQPKKSWIGEKAMESPLSTTTNMMAGPSSQQIQPNFFDRRVYEKINALPEHHKNVIQGFRQGMTFPPLPLNLNCSRETSNDQSCGCRKCIYRGLIYYASLFVYHDLRMESLRQGTDLEEERTRCPPVLDFENGIRLYHVLNISTVVNADSERHLCLARPEHCFVYDAVYQGRYWWRNYPPRETWPIRFSPIRCPSTLAAQWTVYLLHSGYQHGIEFAGSIHQFIVSLQMNIPF